MSGTRIAIALGVIPVMVGVVYVALQQGLGSMAVRDAAGALLLVALGVSMGFGSLVILRGARDL